MDVCGAECADHALVEREGRAIAQVAGFEEIRTPVFEFTDLFARSLGAGSDVVSKEMYTFEDRSGNSLTLRPEGTAGVCRAALSRKDVTSLQKLFYCGPMFRYERPQHGRQRQFTQLGVEVLGASGPSADVEVIEAGALFLERLGLLGIETAPETRLLVNSLGDHESREAYQRELGAHLDKFKGSLSADSERRVSEGRYLRVLDSKDEADMEAVCSAPLLEACLTEDARRRFDVVKEGLTQVGIDFEIDPLLVRGLDYYTHTIFEFVVPAHAAQRPSAILAGGRYDGLSSTLGFKDEVPGIGWAAGVERLVLERARLALPAGGMESPPVVFLAPIVERDEQASTIHGRIRTLAATLRRASPGLVVHTWLEGLDAPNGMRSALRKAFRGAERANADFIGFIGAEEAASGDLCLTVKHLESGEQQQLFSLQEILGFCARFAKPVQP
ncbi:Histidine--tRNA ligase [Hondaea fermentalgiana]|uniref:histidine--tRNA ligase n=1 Tax=Hondaea fermentalgiana TaxID=2315210 RepID=A0A2R5G6H6_9STRA|nr:Histidine--tRNA ligase [Hondaea fermentalgiana]|eukprot:GBG26600.1 Histidine--tRNA ligase [Hondaea fermentalgiana]